MATATLLNLQTNGTLVDHDATPEQQDALDELAVAFERAVEPECMAAAAKASEYPNYSPAEKGNRDRTIHECRVGDHTYTGARLVFVFSGDETTGRMVKQELGEHRLGLDVSRDAGNTLRECAYLRFEGTDRDGRAFTATICQVEVAYFQRARAWLLVGVLPERDNGRFEYDEPSPAPPPAAPYPTPR